MTVALIPVKELSKAKERLSPVLDGGGRRTLALAMFRDVLAAALACDALDGVAVVSRDEEILAEARAEGAEAMAEPGGLNEALELAARNLAERGVERIVVLAADLPSVDAAVLKAITTSESNVDVVVAFSYDDGTSAMWLRPGAIVFKYGDRSGERHMRAAEQRGLTCTSIHAKELAFDVDTPDDLEELVERAAGRDIIGTHTRFALESLGLLTRTAS